MKRFTTIQLHVKVPEDTAEQIEKLVNPKHITVADQLREFIDKIVVHERSEPWKKKNYTQQVDVYFNFVGRV